MHTGQGVLEGLLVEIVDLDHLGVSFNLLGSLYGARSMEYSAYHV
jgi:hypothetical protein